MEPYAMIIATSIPRTLRRSHLLASAAGLAAWLGVAGVAAAGPCLVTMPDDVVTVVGSLRYCVDQVNQGLTDEVVVQAAHWYSPNSPLVIERSARISGYGRIVMPGDEFVGDSLFVVGPVCPGPSCEGLVSVEIEGLELAAVGFAGVRGIDLRAGHELQLVDVQLYEFQIPGSGGCVRAGNQSRLGIFGTTLEGCSAAEGGAVFSEATLTVVDGSELTANAAVAAGGAIAIADGDAPRTLRVDRSSFELGTAAWGGAIAAAGSEVEVEVTASELLGNQATTYGGGLYGTGTVSGSRVEGNQAGTAGGGIHFVQDGTVLDSTVLGNLSGTGGGIAFDPGGGDVLRVEHSTIAQNKISGDITVGAGVAVLGGDAVVRNSTFSENMTADANGGGLGVAAGKVTVEHVTFAGNVAILGGGIYLAAPGSIELRSSIVAYSTGDDCKLLGGFATTTSLDTDGSCGVDLSGVDPQLDSFGDHGGPTWTWLPNAPEVQDAAECFASEDQRHEPRPDEHCDIGAVEL